MDAIMLDNKQKLFLSGSHYVLFWKIITFLWRSEFITEVFHFQKIALKEQLYIVDNLAFFIYQTQDEPLFIIHQIDIIVSVTGSNLLQSFREVGGV